MPPRIMNTCYTKIGDTQMPSIGSRILYVKSVFRHTTSHVGLIIQIKHLFIRLGLVSSYIYTTFRERKRQNQLPDQPICVRPYIKLPYDTDIPLGTGDSGT